MKKHEHNAWFYVGKKKDGKWVDHFSKSNEGAPGVKHDTVVFECKCGVEWEHKKTN